MQIAYTGWYLALGSSRVWNVGRWPGFWRQREAMATEEATLMSKEMNIVQFRAVRIQKSQKRRGRKQIITGKDPILIIRRIARELVVSVERAIQKKSKPSIFSSPEKTPNLKFCHELQSWRADAEILNEWYSTHMDHYEGIEPSIVTNPFSVYAKMGRKFRSNNLCGSITAAYLWVKQKKRLYWANKIGYGRGRYQPYLVCEIRLKSE
jgi:hypothetical protein